MKADECIRSRRTKSSFGHFCCCCKKSAKNPFRTFKIEQNSKFFHFLNSRNFASGSSTRKNDSIQQKPTILMIYLFLQFSFRYFYTQKLYFDVLLLCAQLIMQQFYYLLTKTLILYLNEIIFASTKTMWKIAVKIMETNNGARKKKWQFISLLSVQFDIETRENEDRKGKSFQFYLIFFFFFVQLVTNYDKSFCLTEPKKRKMRENENVSVAFYVNFPPPKKKNREEILGWKRFSICKCVMEKWIG